VKLKKYCVALLEMFGSLSYTRHTFEELDTEARTGVAKHGGKPMLEDILDKMLEWKSWTERNKPVVSGSLFATKNVSSVHVLLVANSYLLLLHYRFAETMTDNCGKCVDNLICSMGIRYVANSTQYLLLCIILFMLKIMYMTLKDMLCSSTVICCVVLQ